ncbi:MAG: hypothetical protein IAG10_14060 [Planctomycetaceae bacterium]|nr:hypothetical protein [Planctomycetaceae bacterium]
MTKSSVANCLLDGLQNLHSKECWRVFCGPSTGTSLDIHFCPLVARQEPLRNPKLSELERTHSGAIGLFVHCSWRLQTSERVVAASGVAEADSELVWAVPQILQGRKVEAITGPTTPSNDVAIRFSDGIEFLIFCDLVGEDAGDNYSLFLESGIITVGPGGLLRRS